MHGLSSHNYAGSSSFLAPFSLDHALLTGPAPVYPTIALSSPTPVTTPTSGGSMIFVDFFTDIYCSGRYFLSQFRFAAVIAPTLPAPLPQPAVVQPVHSAVNVPSTASARRPSSSSGVVAARAPMISPASTARSSVMDSTSVPIAPTRAGANPPFHLLTIRFAVVMLYSLVP